MKKEKEDLDSMGLPPPIYNGDTVYWLPMYRTSRQVPWGYKEDPNNREWWLPVPEELEALEKAKEFLSQYSLRTVSEWLTEETGRYISHVGLDKRIKTERARRSNFRRSQKLAERFYRAYEETKKLEEKVFGRRKVEAGTSIPEPTPAGTNPRSSDPG